MEKTLFDRVLKAAGGYTKLGAALKSDKHPNGITKAAVWQWRKPGREIPAEHCPTIERITGIPCEELRPDVEWRVLRGVKLPKRAGNGR